MLFYHLDLEPEPGADRNIFGSAKLAVGEYGTYCKGIGVLLSQKYLISEQKKKKIQKMMKNIYQCIAEPKIFYFGIEKKENIQKMMTNIPVYCRAKNI